VTSGSEFGFASLRSACIHLSLPRSHELGELLDRNQAAPAVLDGPQLTSGDESIQRRPAQAGGDLNFREGVAQSRDRVRLHGTQDALCFRAKPTTPRQAETNCLLLTLSARPPPSAFGL